MDETAIGVGGMSCQGCVNAVQGALSRLPGVAAVEVSLEKQEAKVRFDAAQQSLAALRSAIEAAGFETR
ncbi:heavy-metal-associated domain-containing protein [Niveibacterium sp. SC-1]|uniref:heavy-metal-associated domain-containing protein n=1 Tax=Niveibacterium sp. SC-1 TaxID=3135646 RepID=UPI00311ED549